MRKALVILLGICLLAMLVGSVSARDIDKTGKRIMRAMHDDENLVDLDQGARALMTSAAVDTFCLVWYDFEQMQWQGWTTLDNTAQIEVFFHVDDFAGLGGGSYGGLFPADDTKSMWCGTRAANDGREAAPFWYLCSWSDAPGYGNSWNQILTTNSFAIDGLVTFTYHALIDSEPDYDYTYVEYDVGDGNWIELAAYDGVQDTVAIHTILPTKIATKLRFHFISDGAWSDQDGLWNTDGACIIDEINVSDFTGLINYENWEDEPLDQTHSDDNFWYGKGETAFGAFVGLYNGLVDMDPCADNLATQVIFFQGSSYPSADYPNLFDTPFCTGPGNTSAPCQNESLVSPEIDFGMYSSACDENQDLPIPPAVLPGLGGCVYRFTVYRDIPLPNLVFYTWGVRSLVSGCPGQWRDRNYVYYGGDKDYIQTGQDISDLVGTDNIQVQIGVSDMCDAWFIQYGDCAAHTPSPWIDNVRVYRYATVGPQWSYRSLDIFQDNFPGGMDIESYVRADAANDSEDDITLPIDPYDWSVFDCTSPLAGGLNLIDQYGNGPVDEEVYCHVKATYIGPAPFKTLQLFGTQMLGADADQQARYVADDGVQWTIMHCPNARSGYGSGTSNDIDDKYMVDFNDSLFSRGYLVEYYFRAVDLSAQSSTLPSEAMTGGRMFEFLCLPTLNSDMLYVDDYHGRGTFDGTVQTYFDPAFAAVIPGDVMPDRYDVNSPSSLVSNGPGSRATYQHMAPYHKVIWDSGNLNSGTICEGTQHSDKGNDAQLLVDWLMYTEHKVGLWVLGDEVASDLAALTAGPSALMLRATICGVSVVSDSYYNLTGGRVAGGVVTPLVTGIGIYSGLSYYAFAGCPIINSFDVLETTGPGVYSLQLPTFNSLSYYIGISTNQLNAGDYPMRTSWVGHSFMYIRNGNNGTLARNEMVKKTWQFFENDVDEDVTDADVPAVYTLAQNYPNPFNPSTTIKFDMPVKGHVSLKIYNVAGQLVRTLTNEVWEAGNHSKSWNGTNDLGSSVASGVYFYKLNAGDYESTKKMILLR